METLKNIWNFLISVPSPEIKSIFAYLVIGLWIWGVIAVPLTKETTYKDYLVIIFWGPIFLWLILTIFWDELKELIYKKFVKKA